MKRIFFSALCLLSAACHHEHHEEETYPNEPKVTLEEFKFVKGTSPDEGPTVDTIFLTFGITDGDENFGLDFDNPADRSDPFQDLFFVKKSNGELVSSTKVGNHEIGGDEILSLADRENPPYDTLPDLDHGCYAYITDPQAPEPKDYKYFIFNQNSVNMLTTIVYQQADNTFAPLKDLFPFFSCYPLFAYVIPRIANNRLGMKFETNTVSVDMSSSKKGRITVAFPSINWRTMPSNKVKLSFYVQDRALNKSNVIETPVLTLE